MNATTRTLPNGATLEISEDGWHVSVRVNRDSLVDRLQLSPDPTDLARTNVPERVLAAAQACTIAGARVLHGVGMEKNPYFLNNDRWYEVHVPAGHADEAAEALTAAEIHANATPLHNLTQTLDSLANQLARALPPRDNNHPESRRRAHAAELIGHFGEQPRYNIYMFPLLGHDHGGHNMLVASTDEQRKLVHEISQQFRREGEYDLDPFHPDNDEQHGVLLLSEKFEATCAIAAGAAGFSPADDSHRWQLDWIWLHPYERGNGTIDTAWNELEATYGQFLIDGPYSPAMQRLIRRREIPRDRLTQPLP